MSVFLPYQTRWLLDKSPVRVCVKSRRVGMTWAEAYGAMECGALRREDGGSNYWYQTYAEDDAREFIDDVSRFSKALNASTVVESEGMSPAQAAGYFILPTNVNAAVKVTSVRFASGHRVTSLPHLPRKLRGKGGRYCLDEAAFHEDVGGALKAAQAFRVWGGRVTIISTYNGDDNEFCELVEDIRSKKLDYSLHVVTLPDAVKQGLYKRICAVQKKEWTPESEKIWLDDLLSTEGAEEEFLCVPSTGTKRYLPVPLIEACMTEEIKPPVRIEMDGDFMLSSVEYRTQYITNWLEQVIRPLLPKYGPTWLGQDFGRTIDLSVIGVNWNGALRLTIEMRNMPYEQQRQVLFFLIDNLPRFTHGAIDSTGNGAWLGEVAQQTYGPATITAYKINEAWYAEAFPLLKSKLEDRSLMLPFDRDMRTDLSTIEIRNGVPRVPRSRAQQRHGDSAVMLGCLVLAMQYHTAGNGAYLAASAKQLFRSKGLML